MRALAWKKETHLVMVKDSRNGKSSNPLQIIGNKTSTHHIDEWNIFSESIQEQQKK
jgi:hypothetical protein